MDILTYHHYTVDAVYDGDEALAYAQLVEYDGIILDIMMPKKDGLEVLKALRNLGSKTPIMLLTAKSEIEDQILGLDGMPVILVRNVESAIKLKAMLVSQWVSLLMVT